MTSRELARRVMERIAVLGKISEDDKWLTRLSWSPAMRRANDQVARWMREAGMQVREDAIGNLIGRYPGSSIPASPARGKTFLVGSHLDTVRHAGRFDGALGVLVGIACVEKFRRENRPLPFPLEVIGFADEEGQRFQTAYLGSGVFTGSTTKKDLQRMDASGVSLATAIRWFGGRPTRLETARRKRHDLLGYAELHIEQGPVLENRGVSVGVVSGIVGITRAQLRFLGRAGHAGTTPMKSRRDALCAASEFILAIERYARKSKGLVATVGELQAMPGAVNVIPGQVVLSLDVRHENDTRRNAACGHLLNLAKKIGAKRKVRVKWLPRARTSAIPCSPRLGALLKQSAQRYQSVVPTLTSGAGHDAAEMARITPVTMLFVRCKKGISHNPAESVRESDISVAIAVMSDFLESLVSAGFQSIKS